MSRSSTVLVMVLGVACFSLLPAVGLAETGSGEATLHERLGGTYNIAAVVDDLIERVTANDALNENPAIAEARKPGRFPGLKYHLTEMVCQATGGPCTYTGMSMPDSHVSLNITAAEWSIFETDCKTTFDKFSVPAEAQEELMAIIRTTKGDIVAE